MDDVIDQWRKIAVEVVQCSRKSREWAREYPDLNNYLCSAAIGGQSRITIDFVWYDGSGVINLSDKDFLVSLADLLVAIPDEGSSLVATTTFRRFESIAKNSPLWLTIWPKCSSSLKRFLKSKLERAVTLGWTDDKRINRNLTLIAELLSTS